MQKKAKGSLRLHQKNRRLTILQEKLARLQADKEAGIVRLCFGSKKLFRAQLNINSDVMNKGKDNKAKNNNKSVKAVEEEKSLNAERDKQQKEWKEAWQRSRSNQFFVLGSQDETAGCQSCQAFLAEDGSLTLQLRLPNLNLSDLTNNNSTEKDKYLLFKGVRFPYGHTEIVSALNSSKRILCKTKKGKDIVKRVGTALSYRFIRDNKGWRVMVSVAVPHAKKITHAGIGAIGVDINADHLAIAETDRFGNLINSRKIDLVTYRKSTNQSKAIIGDAVVSIVKQAVAVGKPIIMEKLDFQKKKAELETATAKQSRMLSSFSYGKIISSMRSACARMGVELRQVNPAYTSVIGAVNYAQVKGISVHMGAAFAIARRGLGLSERSTVRRAVVPMRNGGHVTFVLPVRNRAKHGWSFWSKVRTSLKAAHGAPYRLGKLPPKPLPPKPRQCVQSDMLR